MGATAKQNFFYCFLRFLHLLIKNDFNSCAFPIVNPFFLIINPCLSIIRMSLILYHSFSFIFNGNLKLLLPECSHKFFPVFRMIGLIHSGSSA